jgi:hypothetical protein
MKTRHGVWTLGFALLVAGCQSGVFSSDLDASADIKSLSTADRTAFCESASDYIIAQVGQEEFDNYAAVAQSIGAETVAECKAAVPTYLSFAPYHAFSSCSGIAEVLAGCADGVTVGEMEDLMEQTADNLQGVIDKMSCDLASKQDEVNEIYDAVQAVPESLKDAQACLRGEP